MSTNTMTMVKPQPSRTPGAASDTTKPGSKKSGYTKNIMPERVSGEEAEGRAAPVASESGRQEGRVPPAQRKTTGYKAVTAAEADELLRKRWRGELEPIPGGLDTPGVPKQPPTQYEDERMEQGDAQEHTPTDQNATLQQLAALLANGSLAKLNTDALSLGKPADHVGIVTTGEVIERKPQTIGESEVSKFLNNRARVQLQIEGAGTYTVPAIDVVDAGFGVLVLLPASDDSAIFVPNPGTRVQVSFKDKRYDCYFPGVSGEITALKIMVIAMVHRPGETDGEA